MEVITLGNNISPPLVCMESTIEIYKIIKSEDFEVAKFNALLMAVMTYIDKHGAYYPTATLPWAEEIEES